MRLGGLKKAHFSGRRKIAAGILPAAVWNGLIQNLRKSAAGSSLTPRDHIFCGLERSVFQAFS